MRVAFGLLLALGILAPTQALACGYALGFRALRDLIPLSVGDCLEDEHHGDNGDGLQRTTGGLLVWRKADNWTAFTDGYRTWVNGPFGLQQRPNTERFPWEGGVLPSAEEVVRGDPSRPWVSLVFNAGAGYAPAPAILDTLRGKGVRTTFFLMGWWAEKQPDLVRRIAADGHEIASHGYEIFDLTEASDAAVADDLEHADRVLAPLAGRTTKPLWSPSAGYRDARVRRIAASLGYRPIMWTLDSGDWRVDSTADGVRRRVLDDAVNGAIIVMHFESPRTADTVAPVLPDIVDGLRARGFRLVTITELLTGALRP